MKSIIFMKRKHLEFVKINLNEKTCFFWERICLFSQNNRNKIPIVENLTKEPLIEIDNNKLTFVWN